MCLEFLCSWSHKEEDGPEHHPPSKPRPERPSNGNTNLARQDPPLKPPPEPYSGNKNPGVGGVAVNNGDTKRKDENPRTSALARPQVANNTVLAAPVQQPNPRRGADSNLMHNNNHYPTVGDGARRNGHMRKDEEEDR